MKKLLTEEPAAISGLVQAILALLLAFGVEISKEQMGAILTVTAAILAVLTRALVTPVAKL